MESYFFTFNLLKWLKQKSIQLSNEIIKMSELNVTIKMNYTIKMKKKIYILY